MMHNSAASGYLIKALDLIRVLPKAIQSDYLQFVNDNDHESVETLLSEHLPKSFPKPESVFLFSSSRGMESDSLEDETLYVTWADEDLFTKTPTPEMREMQKKSVAPDFSRWVCFG